MSDYQPIECQDLTKRFGRFVAVDRISFAVAAGTIFGFLGPNGSGKSTTIRMLCGLLRPSEGTARVDGIDVSADPEGVKRRIGYMSQKFSLYDDLTVRENLEFYGGIYGLGRRERSQRIEEVLGALDLGVQGRLLVRELSAGVRQRLGLAAAILHRPPILFLDEPTSGVDPISRRRFWDLIYDLASEGATVLVTTHYMDEAEHCRQIVLIRSGRIVASGSPAALKAELVPGPVYAVACDRPFEAASILQALPGVQEAALYGSLLHVITEPSDRVGRDPDVPFERALAEHGIRLESVERVDPSLEDAFVAVAGGPAE